MEIRLTARRGENLLAMVVIPAAALVFFGVTGRAGSVATVLPAALALAVVASGLVNLGIATAYERGYGVLKRLGGAPLGRTGLVTSKLAVVGLIAIVQVAALVAVAGVVLAWVAGPDASVVVLVVVTLVGAAAFASIGLFLAGALRPEAALVVANALFLTAVLLGGLVVPIGSLPGPLATLAELLPFGALAGAFAAALGDGGELGRHLTVVVAWGLVALVATVRTFRWD